MGYTHYWTQSKMIEPDKWADFTNKVALIIKTADDAGIPLGNYDGQGTPHVTTSMIAFNGFANFGYESFILDNGGEAWTGKAFCKTGQRPYDSVVTAVLILLKHEFADGFTVKSDGNWSDWTEGRNLYAETFGVEPEESWVF